MAFSDLETVLAAASNVFGQGVFPNFTAGLVLLLGFFVFCVTLGVGFEATAILSVVLSYGLITAGLLPTYLMGVWEMAAAVVFTIVLTLILRRS